MHVVSSIQQPPSQAKLALFLLLLGLLFGHQVLGMLQHSTARHRAA
jgi:hypothetical protein